MSVFLLLLTGALATAARARWSAEEAFRFVSTSLALGYSDVTTARQLRNVDLTQRLTDEPIELLKRQGVGPLTVRVLEGLRVRSSSLEPPAGPIVTMGPPPSETEVKTVLRRVSEYSSNYVRLLPDFSCQQTTRFYTYRARLGSAGDVQLAPGAPSQLGKDLHLEKTVVEELEYYQGQERYRTKLVDNKPDNRPVRLDTAPIISRGELGTLLRAIFDKSSGAQFRWDHGEVLHGHRVEAFSYDVDRAHSQLRVCCREVGPKTFFPAYGGVVYVDPDSGAVVRLELRYTGFQPRDPFRDARILLDYAQFEVGGKTYWLPARSVMTARSDEFQARSEMDFSNYRKFQADSTIKFGP